MAFLSLCWPTLPSSKQKENPMTKQSRVLLILTLVACDAVESDIAPENTMLISALSAEEEGMINQEQAETEKQNGPDMFRTCDRRAFFDALSPTETPEESDSGWLDNIGDAFSKKGKKGKKRAGKMLKRLKYIYDVDEDGVFSESEKEEIFADFDARCEVLHEKLLTEFDADEDGVLSEEEKELARETVRDLKESHRQSHSCDKDDDEEKPNLPKFAREFDLDGDDELSESELQTLRDVLRERIRNGEAWNLPQQVEASAELEEEIEEEGASETLE